MARVERAGTTGAQLRVRSMNASLSAYFKAKPKSTGSLRKRYWAFACCTCAFAALVPLRSPSCSCVCAPVMCRGVLCVYLWVCGCLCPICPREHFESTVAALTNSDLLQFCLKRERAPLAAMFTHVKKVATGGSPKGKGERAVDKDGGTSAAVLPANLALLQAASSLGSAGHKV